MYEPRVGLCHLVQLEARDRAAAILENAQHHVLNAFEPNKAIFHDVLRTRLAASMLALDAAQAGALQFGARGYINESEIYRRIREAQFVAIVTPSVKHITKELASKS